jgi:hypothetical protein
VAILMAVGGAAHLLLALEPFPAGFHLRPRLTSNPVLPPLLVRSSTLPGCRSDPRIGGENLAPSSRIQGVGRGIHRGPSYLLTFRGRRKEIKCGGGTGSASAASLLDIWPGIAEIQFAAATATSLGTPPRSAAAADVICVTRRSAPSSQHRLLLYTDTTKAKLFRHLRSGILLLHNRCCRLHHLGLLLHNK